MEPSKHLGPDPRCSLPLQPSQMLFLVIEQARDNRSSGSLMIFSEYPSTNSQTGIALVMLDRVYRSKMHEKEEEKKRMRESNVSDICHELLEDEEANGEKTSDSKRRE